LLGALRAVFGVSLEGGELVCPESLHLFDPILYGEERIPAQAIDAETGVQVGGLRLQDFYQASAAQNTEMAAHGGTADGTPGGEFAGGEVTGTENLHYTKAGGVGESGECGRQVINQ
jgi:hypothetical protein